MFILGKDGYEALKESKKIIDIQNSTVFQNIMNEFFGFLFFLKLIIFLSLRFTKFALPRRKSSLS